MPFIDGSKFDQLDDMDRIKRKKTNRVENMDIAHDIKIEKKPSIQQQIDYINHIAKHDDKTQNITTNDVKKQIELTSILKEKQEGPD